MKEYKGYLVDLDGTMYRGSEKIEAASDFVKTLKNRNMPYLFLTNNSSATPEKVAEKLIQMDIPTVPEQVVTSSMATAAYIQQQKKDATVYVIGEEGLTDAIKKSGLTITDSQADYVVVGIDREISYEKLAKGCLMVRDGAKFLSTNADVAIPIERGLLPGNGSLTSVITVSTGVQPVFIGKPEPIIMEYAIEKMGLDKEETMMVGDNYQTDILAGIRAGIDTLMVFTGITSEADLMQEMTQPTYQVHSLMDWLPNIR
ncbi:TIGR01457 family HAD-type hydrolase [Radiobacillus kanasensis]|uniref:TIGR01457 family HAD-type hydrolase n=1 Tax=Radiobacillus kanasensis TaxID=2844358 RepID=UPI001E4279FF|nr:TIGR01457 family HAD-type hydrolase [Radiobacillus kanasensis]UFT98228.1 TIGR01457 family HAD-type hydrolase [Radiobacillus kanasensis]